MNGYQKKSLRVSAGVLSTAVLGSALLFSGVPRVQADDDQAKCQHRIEKAEARLDDAVPHHGERSPEAESRRRDLNAERERCWNAYHGYWSGSDHRWHSQRDWDHDHDHDDHH